MLIYSNHGNFWVIKNSVKVFNRSMCVQWERKSDGKLWPERWEAGFETEMEARNYLVKRK